MKKVCFVLATLLLVCVLVMPVLAAPDEAPIHIAGNTYYDASENTFLYYVNTTTLQVLRCTVADGMITDQAVTVQADAGVALAVYLNGNLQEGAYSGTFQTPGEYVVMYVGGAVSERILSFTIVPALCNYVTAYVLPAGFEITEASLNGTSLLCEKNYIKLTDEGEYNIHYRCIRTDIPYQLVVRTDFTGPILHLEEVTDGTASGPVDISEAKLATELNIYHNGERIAKKYLLTESGEYLIELADEAGNKTSYSFTILIYFDGNSWLFFLILSGAVILLVAYLIHARRHLRVR